MKVDAETTLAPPRRAARLPSWAGKLLDADARKGALSLVDQAVVSGASFLATIIVGRACGPDELGVYALVFTLMVLVTCAQQSLLMTPYTSYVNRLPISERREYAGSALAQYALLASLALAGLALAGLVFALGVGPKGLAAAVGMLAVAMPFVLLRDFGRHVCFAHLHLSAAVGLDAATAAIQLAGLLALASLGGLSASSAFVLLGVGCALPGLTWLWNSRRAIALRRDKWLPRLRQNWAFGRWVFAAQITFLIHSYLVQWMLALERDARATGIFSACTMIVYLSNPFIQGVGNILYPWVTRAFASGGDASTRRLVARATLLMGSVMGAFFFALLLLGDRLMRFFYGSEYAGHAATISVLAAGAWISSLCLAAGHGLWAREQPKVHFVASLVGMAATLLAGFWLVGLWGPLGGAWALLAGNVTSSGLICFVFFKRSPSGRREGEAPAEILSGGRAATLIADAARREPRPPERTRTA